MLRTEKLFTSGYITLDIINDSVSGLPSIVDFFEHMLIKQAAALGFVLLRPPKVYFKQIDELSASPMDLHMYESQMLKVHVIGRGVRVTKLATSFPQGAIHTC